MRRPTDTRRCRRFATWLLTFAAVAAAAAYLVPDDASAAAPPAWRALTQPWSDGATVNDIGAAGPSLLAAVGAEGHIAVSQTGGVSWTPPGPTSQTVSVDLYGVAFADADHGVAVGAQGTVLVTGDGGATWAFPTFSGAPPTADLHDVAMVGTQAVAVGAGGLAITSDSAGESWRSVNWPTNADLRAVALTSDGAVIAGADDGTVLARRAVDWRKLTMSHPVTSVAAAFFPAWGDGGPDLVASSGWEVIGSDDGDSFTTMLDARAYATEPLWPAVAWSGAPAGDLLLAGPAGDASYYSVAPPTWRPGTSGLGDAFAASAAEAQSVAYALDTTGRLARTLSSGRLAATLAASAGTITAGRSVTLTSTVRVAAPGSLILERRVVGGRWRTAGLLDWTTLDWERAASFRSKPTLSNDFRLRFSYGGQTSIVSTTRRVKVRPKLTPDKLRITLRRGQTYRFKGTVYPRLRGEKVRLYTNRGGSWHRITLGGVVKLRDGKRWVSRLFGTPKRETYRLRARAISTRRHASAWSPVVTVRIR